MNTTALNTFNSSAIIFVVVIILSIVLIVLIWWNIRTDRRLRKFFNDSQAQSLEDVFSELINRVETLENDKEVLAHEILILKEKASKSIRSIETLRFNPFKDAGGNQSFAMALLNDESDGVIISSLYSRERVSVFAKPIKKGVSEFDLTSEEKETLKRASAQ